MYNFHSCTPPSLDKAQLSPTSSSGVNQSSGPPSTPPMDIPSGPPFIEAANKFSLRPYEQASYPVAGLIFPEPPLMQPAMSTTATVQEHVYPLLPLYHATPLVTQHTPYTSLYPPILHGPPPQSLQMPYFSAAQTPPVQAPYFDGNIQNHVSVKHEPTRPAAGDLPILPVPPTGFIGSSTVTFARAKDKDDVHEHFAIPEAIGYPVKEPKSGFICKIQGCGRKITPTISGGKQHVDGYHLPPEVQGNQANMAMMIQCKWVGKGNKVCDRDMKATELGRHLIDTHIRPVLWHCPVCTTFKSKSRKDVVKSHVRSCYNNLIREKQGYRHPQEQLKYVTLITVIS